MGLSNELFCEAGVSPTAASTPTGVFNQWFEALFSCAGALGLHGLFRSPFVPPGLSMHECGAAGSASCRLACPIRSTIRHLAEPASPCLATSPLCPGCPSPPLLPVWMNVSSLSPWLWDFHTVRFSVSSGCFLFLNCCPSFGCARRHSVSTYASILAGSPHLFFFLMCLRLYIFLEVGFTEPNNFQVKKVLLSITLAQFSQLQRQHQTHKAWG